MQPSRFICFMLLIWLTGMQRCWIGFALFGVLLMGSVQAAPVDKSVTTLPSSPISLMDDWHWQVLPAQWWRTLERASPEQARQSLLALQQQLMQAIAQIDNQEQQTDMRSLLAAIAFNQRSYLGLIQKNITVMAKQPELLEHYSLMAWREALQQLRISAQALQEKQIELTQLSAQLDAIEHEADDAEERYERTVVTDANKLMSALGMIERRLAWLSAQQAIRLQQQQLQQLVTQHQYAQYVWQQANTHLQLQTQDTQQIRQRIEKTQQQVEKKQEAVRQLQAKVVLVMGDDALAPAKVYNDQVNLLVGQIQLLLEQVQWQWEQQLLVYVQARQQVDFNWDAALRQPLMQWKKQWQQLNDQQQQLQVQLESRRNQIQTALLALPDTGEDRQMQQRKQDYQLIVKRLGDEQTLLKNVVGLLQELTGLSEQQQALLLAHDGIWFDRWHRLLHWIHALFTEVVSGLTAPLFTLGNAAVTLWSLIQVIILMVLIWWGSVGLRQGLMRFTENNDKISQHSAHTLGRLIHYTIMTVGVIVALSLVGIDLSSLAWIAGALSVGIGFGLRDIVKNFAAGLIIMFERTLKLGDSIELSSGVAGKVKDIGLHSTLIITSDNLDVVVPNAEFISGRVLNWTLSDLYRRIHIPFSVVLSSDKRQVVEVVLAAAKSVPYTLQEAERMPQVVLTDLEGKMSFELLVWIKQGAVKFPYGVKAAYLWQIESALRERGIRLYEVS